MCLLVTRDQQSSICVVCDNIWSRWQTSGGLTMFGSVWSFVPSQSEVISGWWFQHVLNLCLNDPTPYGKPIIHPGNEPNFGVRSHRPLLSWSCTQELSLAKLGWCIFMYFLGIPHSLIAIFPSHPLIWKIPIPKDMWNLSPLIRRKSSLPSISPCPVEDFHWALGISTEPLGVDRGPIELKYAAQLLQVRPWVKSSKNFLDKLCLRLEHPFCGLNAIARSNRLWNRLFFEYLRMYSRLYLWVKMLDTWMKVISDGQPFMMDPIGQNNKSHWGFRYV